jgi:hypothetical protein
MEYEDSVGTGYAEIDLLVVLETQRIALIFECKRTFTARGLVQLGQLYGPLVRKAMPSLKVYQLLVCKNLNPDVRDKHLVPSLSAWFDLILAGGDLPILTLQWRGVT